MGEQSRERREDGFQSLGFIIRFSFSSVSYNKLWWQGTQSQDRAQRPAGELGVGKSHRSRHVPLMGLNARAASDTPSPPRPRARSLRGQACGAEGGLKACPLASRGRGWS